MNNLLCSILEFYYFSLKYNMQYIKYIDKS
jgi:hypothetical protein